MRSSSPSTSATSISSPSALAVMSSTTPSEKNHSSGSRSIVSPGWPSTVEL
jgi:hypothetical protein